MTTTIRTAEISTAHTAAPRTGLLRRLLSRLLKADADFRQTQALRSQTPEGLRDMGIDPADAKADFQRPGANPAEQLPAALHKLW